MKTIPQETVETAWNQISELSQEQTRKLARRMQKEQGFIMVYLLAAEEVEKSAREPGWLMELGAFVWWVMSRQNQPLRTVTGKQLEAAEAANSRHLHKLDEGSEMDWQNSAAALIGQYNQAPLLGWVIQALMAGHEETPELVGDEAGAAFLQLKTIIDCLDQ